MRHARVLVTILLVLAACRPPAQLAPTVGSDAPFPPPAYATWWRQLQVCSGIAAPIDSALPGGFIPLASATVMLETGEQAGALYQREAREIWVGRAYLADRVVVQHEMLHALLATRGIVGHPPEYFGPGSRCGLPVTLP